MQKHIQLVAILNIVYRSLMIVVSMILLTLCVWITGILESLLWSGGIRHHEIPSEIIDIIPIILTVVAGVMFVFSVVGIIGAVGVLKRKEWGRVILLIVSFFNLLHIPLGTILGIYSIWVLMNDETMKICNPTQGGQLAPP